MAKQSRNVSRLRRHRRVRTKISGNAERPRLCVFRSLNEIYAQVIDDEAGTTLVSVSSIDKVISKELAGKSKSEQASLIGTALGKRAKDKGIKKVVFDRGGYRYIGRVKALAEAAREAGLEF